MVRKWLSKLVEIKRFFRMIIRLNVVRVEIQCLDYSGVKRLMFYNIFLRQKCVDQRVRSIRFNKSMNEKYRKYQQRNSFISDINRFFIFNRWLLKIRVFIIVVSLTPDNIRLLLADF